METMNNHILNAGKIVFLLIEAILFCISQFTSTQYVDQLHYSGIVLCFLFAAVFFMLQIEKELWKGLVLAGMFFTCVADFCLILLNDYFVAGVLSFWMTQICYFLYLTRACSSAERSALAGRRIVVAAFISVIAMLVIGQFSSLILVVAFYICTFAGNLIIAWKKYPKQLFSIGLVLFFCCDICVGLSNSGLAQMQGFVVPYAPVFQWMIYIFYMPSQVCIALSILGKKA